MIETPTQPRRWFQFGLRTMFVVVTLAAMWLGWELKVVRARQAAIGELTAESAIVFRPGPGQWPKISFWRRWLGDEEISVFYLAFETAESDEKRIRDLFPETEINRLTPKRVE